MAAFYKVKIPASHNTGHTGDDVSRMRFSWCDTSSYNLSAVNSICLLCSLLADSQSMDPHVVFSPHSLSSAYANDSDIHSPVTTHGIWCYFVAQWLAFLQPEQREMASRPIEIDYLSRRFTKRSGSKYS